MCQWGKLGDLITHRQLKQLPRELPGEGALGRRGQRAECGGRAAREGPGVEAAGPTPGWEPRSCASGRRWEEEEEGTRRMQALRRGVGGTARAHRHRDGFSASRALRDLPLPFLIH